MLNKDNLNSLTSCLHSCSLRSICLLAMLQWLETTVSDIYFQFSPRSVCAVMAEWLRSLTRNQMKSFRVGWNPGDCVKLLVISVCHKILRIFFLLVGKHVISVILRTFVFFCQSK